MSKHKAKELNANARLARPYVAPDMTGRVRHDTIWRRALARWKSGTRVIVRPPRERS